MFGPGMRVMATRKKFLKFLHLAGYHLAGRQAASKQAASRQAAAENKAVFPQEWVLGPSTVGGRMGDLMWIRAGHCQR